MAEEESRTGDPFKDAPPPPKGALAGRMSCIGLIILLAIIIAVVIGNR